MKKALSLLMAFLMLFSTVCVGANAADDATEQTEGKVETEDGRIVLTDDELKEKFGIEKILLPDGFEPVAYVYYNGMCDGELPEYLTFVFDDGTSVEIKGHNSLYSYNGDIRISAFGFLLKSGSGLQFDVYVSSECSKTFRIDCEIKKMSFAEDFDRYKQNISEYYNCFIHGINPKDVFIDDPIAFTGNSAIDFALNTIRGQLLIYPLPEFLIDIVIETAQFLSYRFKEAISFS